MSLPRHKSDVFGGLGLRWPKRALFDLPSSHFACISPSSLEHSRCFNRNTEGANGAADLLEVLRNSPLEKLNFECCSQIPSTAWQRVPSGVWPALHDAPGIPEEELSRIVFGGAAWHGSVWRVRLVLASDSGRTSEPWEPDCFREPPAGPPFAQLDVRL